MRSVMSCSIGSPNAMMLDLKLHDIPRTVAAAVRALVRPPIEILTVHAQGGESMLRAAVEEADEAARAKGMAAPKVFAVTILTSIPELELPELGLTGGMGENVVRLAALARNAGCAGVVCSPREATDLKAFFGSDFAALCPGIRPTGSSAGDQQRITTPAQAIEAGADYLVVGRPITGASDPVAATRAILQEMQEATAA
jgi:orotidine-5'-phosphate decarboxylase